MTVPNARPDATCTTRFAGALRGAAPLLACVLLGLARAWGWGGMRGERRRAQTFGPATRLAARGAAPAATPRPARPARQGARALFATTCGACHALAAAGVAGRVGPDLDAL